LGAKGELAIYRKVLVKGATERGNNRSFLGKNGEKKKRECSRRGAFSQEGTRMPRKKGGKTPACSKTS